MTREPRQAGSSTVDAAEIAHFDALAQTWWDPHGEMRALHMINPPRLGYIRDAACRHFGRDPKRLDCLAGLRILDIGCGAGVLSEPLARIGAAVVGADASDTIIEVARHHAAQSGLTIDYRSVTAEALADAGERFDIVLAMEVVEHVADLHLFVRRCAEMVKPGGLMVVATINRTLKSFALAIVGAEYILRLLPRGTHQWDKLVRPDELEDALAENGLKVVDERGVSLDILAGELKLSNDLDVNYMMLAERPA
jgi:2-polyprenyl-6-hydroxyphenyl methylase / 3-demethylubiquinone-9 3-methyltransferase